MLGIAFRDTVRGRFDLARSHVTPTDFASLYAAELPFVWKSLRRLGASPADLHDLTQEVFTTAFERFSTYDPSRPLRPWLFGIAFRKLAAHRSRVVRAREVSAEALEVHDERPGPEAAAENSLQMARVLKALEALRLERRAVFILHDIEGLSVPEVAASLSIPLNTAYSRLRLARAEFVVAFRKTEVPR